MIAPHELRFGNLIIGTYESEDDNLVHETICEFKFYNCYDNYYHVESKENIEEFTGFKPIPITEDELIKLGFKKHSQDIRFFQKGSLKIKKTDKGFKFSYNESIVYIKNLHHLQNLYLSLTNKELTYNE